MLRVLVLGSNGLIGANIIYSMYEHSKYDLKIFAAVRPTAMENFAKFGIERIFSNDIFVDFEKLLFQSEPDIVINCIGIVSQKFDTKTREEIIKLNSYLPAFLQHKCESHGIKLLNISTDCVFAPDSLNNNEFSTKFANDLYGKSKHLGEINSCTARTIRLSSVGFEHAAHKHGLLEWFLGSQEVKILGYSKVTYSGVAGSEVFRIIDYAIEYWDTFELIHYQGYEINKYELLCLFSDIFGKSTTIVPVSNPFIKRNLKSEIVTPIQLQLPDWSKQLLNLREMRKYYDFKYN